VIRGTAAFRYLGRFRRLLFRFPGLAIPSIAERMAADSHTDIFEFHGVLADYLKTISSIDSLAVLDHYRIDCVLMNSDSQLVHPMKHTPGWRMQYSDDESTLLIRAR
jgi:hypothetical protein